MPPLPWLDFRLVPHSAIADSNGAGLGQGPGGFSHEERPHKDHGSIGQLVTHRFHVRAIRLHLDKEHRTDASLR